MTKVGPQATAALAAAAVLTVGNVTRASYEPIAPDDLREPTVVVHVASYPDLSPRVLAGARARVEKVYAGIGVRIVWADSEDAVGKGRDASLHLTIVLLSREMARKKISAEEIADHVLGLAHLASRRAYIFCERVAEVPGARRLFPLSLGNVIAHEIGHLLLMKNSHSQKGIMRASVDVHNMHQTFDPSEAATIRAKAFLR